MGTGNFSVLIVDDEEDIRDLFDFCLRGKIPCQIIHAANGEEAINFLSEKKIDLIICDYKMPKVSGGEVYQYILKNKLPARFVLVSTNKPSEIAELADRSALYDFIEKPDILNQFRMLVGRLKSEKFAVEEFKQQSFTPISISLLLKIGKMPSDIYIKLADEKFVKVLDKDQVFDETDYLKYSQKVVTSLYCLNLDVEQILECIHNKIISIHALRAEPKLEATVQIHAILVDTFKEYGLRETFIPYVQKQIDDTLQLCEKDKVFALCLNKILNLKGAYLGTHSFLLAAITSMMTTKLNWASDGPNVKLVIASLMHDVFLKDEHVNETAILYQRAYTEDFLTHPQKAADLVNGIAFIPSDTSRIILEQHEIGETYGIPRALSMARVSTLGALFSFCHHFVDYLIEEHKKGPIIPDVIYSRMAELSSNSSHYAKFVKLMREVRFF